MTSGSVGKTFVVKREQTEWRDWRQRLGDHDDLLSVPTLRKHQSGELHDKEEDIQIRNPGSIERGLGEKNSVIVSEAYDDFLRFYQ